MRQQIFSSNPEHEKLSKLSKSAVLRLLGLAKPYALLLGIGSILTLIAAAVSLSIPLVLRYAVDQVTRLHSTDVLDRMAFILIAIMIGSAVIGYAQFMLVAFAGNRIIQDLRARLFSHLQRLPVRFFDQARSGDLASHLSNDVSQLQQTLASDITTFLGNMVRLVGGIVMAVYIDWKLTVVVVALLAVIMAFFVLFGIRQRKITREALDALSETMGAMTEALSNIRLVKAFARERHEDSRAADRLHKVFKANMRSSVSEGMMSMVATAGFTMLLLGVVWYGGRGVLNGSLTTGSLAGFFTTVMIISGPMGSIASLYTRLQRSVGAADRIFALLDNAPEEPDQPDAVAFPDTAGTVEFKSVEFAYLDTTPVLTGLSLKVPAGTITALVGHSGAGKTTIASLLYRFYEPQKGEILIDGVPIRNIRREDLRQHIGIVPQESILFNATIKENIKYGKLDATDEEIMAAAKAANVAEFVAGFPEGYETMIGERGVTLSGGQRQRVAIARALLKDPRILILDEATSALDTKSESLVKEALDRLMQGRTTLVIAHRLSTVQSADQIAVVDDGRIVETGTHEELLKRGGQYADLHNLMPTPAGNG